LRPLVSGYTWEGVCLSLRPPPAKRSGESVKVFRPLFGPSPVVPAASKPARLRSAGSFDRLSVKPTYSLAPLVPPDPLCPSRSTLSHEALAWESAPARLIQQTKAEQMGAGQIERIKAEQMKAEQMKAEQMKAEQVRAGKIE
jgi:hypothetical protein